MTSDRNSRPSACRWETSLNDWSKNPAKTETAGSFSYILMSHLQEAGGQATRKHWGSVSAVTVNGWRWSHRIRSSKWWLYEESQVQLDFLGPSRGCHEILRGHTCRWVFMWLKPPSMDHITANWSQLKSPELWHQNKDEKMDLFYRDLTVPFWC